LVTGGIHPRQNAIVQELSNEARFAATVSADETVATTAQITCLPPLEAGAIRQVTFGVIAGKREHLEFCPFAGAGIVILYSDPTRLSNNNLRYPRAPIVCQHRSLPIYDATLLTLSGGFDISPSIVKSCMSAASGFWQLTTEGSSTYYWSTTSTDLFAALTDEMPWWSRIQWGRPFASAPD